MTEPFDNTQAYQEGWYFYHAYNQVRRTGSPAFASTKDAFEYVRQRAAEGSVYHMDALARVAFAEAEPPLTFIQQTGKSCYNLQDQIVRHYGQ